MRTSWNNTLAIAGTLLLAWELAAPVTAQAEPAPQAGIADAYPRDAGIENDPRVLFTESFEEPTLPALQARWETVGNPETMSFQSDVPAQSGGSACLEMHRERGSGGSLYRRLKNGDGSYGGDQVFARYYVKFATDCEEIHHFGTCIGGNNPSTPWPSVSAGEPTDGAKSFWAGIEPFGSAWTWDYYTYWHEMRGSPPRGQTWGNSFIHNANLKIVKDRWICVEQMIRVNTIGQHDGEMALWIDGQPVSRLRQGAPRGIWVFDKFLPGQGGEGVRWNQEQGDRESVANPPEGTPFEGFEWRTDPALNVNFVWLYVYTQKPPGHRLRVFFDDVVVAREYIGPLKAAP